VDLSVLVELRVRVDLGGGALPRGRGAPYRARRHTTGGSALWHPQRRNPGRGLMVGRQ